MTDLFNLNAESSDRNNASMIHLRQQEILRRLNDKKRFIDSQEGLRAPDFVKANELLTPVFVNAKHAADRAERTARLNRSKSTKDIADRARLRLEQIQNIKQLLQEDHLFCRTLYSVLKEAEIERLR